MTIDRLLAILSLVIGFPAFVALFVVHEHTAQGILVCMIVGLMLAWFYSKMLDKDRPQFDTLELTKVYTVVALNGSFATLRRKERIRSNVNQLTEWWNRGLYQDGSRSNIKIDAKDPQKTEVSISGTAVCKVFPIPLEKNEICEIHLTCDLHDTFLASHEEVIHDNSTNVKELTIQVELPRPCFRAECRRTFSGDLSHKENPPVVSNGNRIITATIKRPLLGASYHVSWDW